MVTDCSLSTLFSVGSLQEECEQRTSTLTGKIEVDAQSIKESKQHDKVHYIAILFSYLAYGRCNDFPQFIVAQARAPVNSTVLADASNAATTEASLAWKRPAKLFTYFCICAPFFSSLPN